MDHGDAGVKIALTIAGSDSGGGAGIQADLKTFAALGVYGASAITALTAQNTLGVRSTHLAPGEIVKAQISAVLEDFEVGAIKIGMLGSAEIAEAVGETLAASPLPLRERVGVRGRSCLADRLPSGTDPSSLLRGTSAARGEGDNPAPPFLVYDPVMAASSGDSLAGDGFLAAIRAHVLPLLDLLTPNLAEAAVLLAQPLACDEAGMIAQGRALLELGPRAILMKGGHLEGDAVDILVMPESLSRFAAPRIASNNLHGTGCTLSSAIAAYVALGLDLAAAVTEAKAFTWSAIERARIATLGLGPGPLLQFPLRLPPDDASA